LIEVKCERWGRLLLQDLFARHLQVVSPSAVDNHLYLDAMSPQESTNNMSAVNEAGFGKL
jgi:hypothetical protein